MSVTNKCERHGQTKEEMESSLRDLLFLLPRLYIGETGENLTTRLTGHKRMTRKGDFNFLTALTYEPHY